MKLQFPSNHAMSTPSFVRGSSLIAICMVYPSVLAFSLCICPWRRIVSDILATICSWEKLKPAVDVVEYGIGNVIHWFFQ